MYLKPGNVFERFRLEVKQVRISSTGRQEVEYAPTDKEILGVVSSLKPDEVEKLKSLKHEADCVIVQRQGEAAATIGDRLIKGTRKFYVEAVENPAGLGQFHLYFCNSRRDLR